MTREEAVERVSRWLDKGKQHEDSQLGHIEGWFTKEDEQAFLMAINALMVGPCEDCISRQAALDTFGLSEKSRKYGGDHSGYDTIMLYEVQDALEALPSVAAEPKKAKWVLVHPLQENDGGAYVCSECRSGDYDCERDKYCRWCGAEMEVIK